MARKRPRSPKSNLNSTTCKYFSEDGTCPQNNCNFLHNFDQNPNRSSFEFSENNLTLESNEYSNLNDQNANVAQYSTVPLKEKIDSNNFSFEQNSNPNLYPYLNTNSINYNLENDLDHLYSIFPNYDRSYLLKILKENNDVSKAVDVILNSDQNFERNNSINSNQNSISINDNQDSINNFKEYLDDYNEFIDQDINQDDEFFVSSIQQDFPNLSIEKCKILSIVSNLYPFITIEEIYKLALKCKWDQFNLIDRLDKLKTRLENSDYDLDQQVNSEPIEEGSKLNIDFPRLGNKTTDLVSDAQYIQKSRNIVYDAYCGKVPRDIIESVLAGKNHSVADAINYLDELFPDTRDVVSPINILKQEPNQKNEFVQKSPKKKKPIKNFKFEDILFKYRNKINEAKEYSDERWEYTSKAGSSYDCGDVQKGQYYRMEVENLRRCISSKFREAYEILSKAKGFEIKIYDLRIDLHGFDQNEVEELIKYHSKTLKMLGIPYFECITGIGKHSRKNAKLPIYIQKVCNNLNLKCSPNRPGSYKISL